LENGVGLDPFEDLIGTVMLPTLRPEIEIVSHYGPVGMALELNSTNSNQFSSETPQLQNSMERPQLWSCSSSRLGVLESLFCSSMTLKYEPRRGD